MLSYRVILDVPLPLAVFVSGLLAAHRREIGTRDGTRALTCWKQAVFTLAWFRDRPDIRRLGQGFGISQATAYRYKDEAVEVLAAEAPTLREALERAVEQGLPAEARPYPKDLPVLADSGYEGAGAGVDVPVKSQPAANSTSIRKPATRSCGPCATKENAASP